MVISYTIIASSSAFICLAIMEIRRLIINIMRTKIFTFTLLLFVYITSVAQVAKSTFVYSIKDNDTLRLDRYSAISESDRSVKPCIVFMFGGGFVGGHRDWEGYLSYFKEMAEKGCCIFYRLSFGIETIIGAFAERRENC